MSRKLLPLTKKLDVNLGYICNNNCLFCYFRNRKQSRSNISTDKAKYLFSQIKKLGIEALEITGGEVTIRDDFFELINFAKKVLKFKYLTVITNGSKTCEPKFLSQAIENGLDELLVSLHGHNAKLHDTLTERKGSFEEATETIKLALNKGISCRTNTVVNNLNYQFLEDIAALLYKLGIKRLNFIYFCPLDDASLAKKEVWPSYSKVSPFASKVIREFKDKFEILSMKVFPFCFLKGYEDYITGYYQNLYDPYEWDYFIRAGIRRGRLLRDVVTAIGIIFFMDIGHMIRIGMKKSLREAILRVEEFRHFVKPLACKKCRFNRICPGLWKDYARIFGTNEVKPVQGKKISEIDFYLNKRFEEFCY
jgi:MoaA/NifB/PqqE/SkfB family radical SAM enzyme